MKKTLLSLAIASLATGQSVCAAVEKVYNEPDSVYIFSYAHPEDEGRSGLKFACNRICFARTVRSPARR